MLWISRVGIINHREGSHLNEPTKTRIKKGLIATRQMPTDIFPTIGSPLQLMYAKQIDVEDKRTNRMTGLMSCELFPKT
jgi:hypothetical protein